MCQFIQFARNAHEAWLAYYRLEQQATPELMQTREYLDRIGAAKHVYFTLAGRKG